MSFQSKHPFLAAAFEWTCDALEIVSSCYERDVALGFIVGVQRRTADPGDGETCTHEFGHGDGADRGHLEIVEASAVRDGESFGRIVAYPPEGRPHPGCTAALFEAWCAYVRMRVEGPAAEARYCIEARGETVTIRGVWRELGVVSGCEEDMLDAREITLALMGDAGQGRELLHRLAEEVVTLIATDDATWRAIQVGASLLREHRRLHGRDVHWLMHRARAREPFDEIQTELRSRIARRNRRQRHARAMSPHLRWLTQGVATRRCA